MEDRLIHYACSPVGKVVTKMQAAIRLEGGGVSKVNIATDHELAALAALGRDKYLTDSEMNALSSKEQADGS